MTAKPLALLRSWAYHRLYGLSPRNQTVYRLCALYADRYRGENNRDKDRNGEFRYLSHVLPLCRTVVDAGAYAGHWASEALAVNPRIDLHCFEPCAATFAHLSERLAERAVLNHCGLSDTSSTATFYPFSSVKQASSLYLREGSPAALGEQTEAETVSLESLDEYCRERGLESIDLLKVDVEGHELAVLQGARDLLDAGAIARVQFEYSSANIHSRVFFKDLFGFLTERDYLIFKLFPSGPRPIPSYDQRLDNFQYANYVAVLPDYREETLAAASS